MGFYDLAELEQQETIKAIDILSKEVAKTISSANNRLKMIVIIPAKDEEASIEKTLSAIFEQRNLSIKTFNRARFEVLVLCHNCNDNTFQKGRLFAESHPHTNIHILILNSEIANTVGAARRVLMNIACARLNIPNGLIISTDADTIPDKYWLSNLEVYQKQEVGMVCGLITVDTSGLNEQTSNYLRAKDEYLHLKTQLECRLMPNDLDPWPKHSYHWGPNIAIKKNVYEAIGGIRPLHFLEDVDLYNRVTGAGYNVRHCLNVKVNTSTRIESRCLEGFGAELRVWTEIEGVAYNVEGIDKLLARFEIYTLIKKYFESPSQGVLIEISDKTVLQSDALLDLVKQSRSCVDMIVKIEMHLNSSSEWNDNFQNIGVVAACTELKNYFKEAALILE